MVGPNHSCGTCQSCDETQTYRGSPNRNNSANSTASVRNDSFKSSLVFSEQATRTCGHSHHAENWASARQYHGGNTQP